VSSRAGRRRDPSYKGSIEPGVTVRTLTRFHTAAYRKTGIGDTYLESVRLSNGWSHGRIRRGGALAIPRVFIVDDNDIVRQGVRHILENEDQWEVIGEASNGEEALRLIPKANPDAIIMDITMPVMNGLDATSHLVKSNPDYKILILTMHSSASFQVPVQRSGAKGLVTKSQAMDELTPALKKILAGQTYFH
jgi:CheY-like chemotaxis protein